MSEQERAWVGLYRSALLELNLDKLSEKIQLATGAIEERLQILGDTQDFRAERQALQDALRNLRLLQRSERA